LNFEFSLEIKQIKRVGYFVCPSSFVRIRNSFKLRRGATPLPQTCTMSNAEEGQTVARISVKDRLGPLPNAGRSGFKRRRGQSGEQNNPRRGRKLPKSVQAPDESESPKTARIPVHERLGALPPEQPFKKSDQLFHKRNRQQVWRHQDYTEVAQQGKDVTDGIIPEMENEKPPFVKPPFVPASVPPRVLQPFNAEQHRQTWTWVRPAANSSTEMDIDESNEKLSP